MTALHPIDNPAICTPAGWARGVRGYHRDLRSRITIALGSLLAADDADVVLLDLLADRLAGGDEADMLRGCACILRLVADPNRDDDDLEGATDAAHHAISLIARRELPDRDL